MEDLKRQMQEMTRNQERIIKENAELKSMLLQLLERGGGGKDVMTTRECADYIGVSSQRIRALVARNEIPFFKNEGETRNYFRRADIDNWRARRRVKTNSELRSEVATRSVLAR